MRTQIRRYCITVVLDDLMDDLDDLMCMGNLMSDAYDASTESILLWIIDSLVILWIDAS